MNTHVDDGCMASAFIAYRPFLEPRTYEEVIRLIFGISAIQEKKNLEEGSPTLVGMW